MIESRSIAAVGYDVLPGFLDPDERELVRSLANAYVDTPAHEGMSRPGSDLHPLRWDDKIVAAILSSNARLERLRMLLGARRLSWLSAYMSSKAGNSPPLAWHQDWWCWDDPISLRPLAPQVALLCYLRDCDEESGALRVIPGSHARWHVLHASLPEPHSETANDLPPGHPALADNPAQRTIKVSTGDAVLVDYRLLHGTHPNATCERRDCILLSFLPDPSLLPTHLKAHLAMHPALPLKHERERARRTSYGRAIARFAESPGSLTINRVPNASFMQRHGDSSAVDRHLVRPNR